MISMKLQNSIGIFSIKRIGYQFLLSIFVLMTAGMRLGLLTGIMLGNLNNLTNNLYLNNFS